MNNLNYKYSLMILAIAICARIIFHFCVYEPFADRFNWGHFPDKFYWYSDDGYDEIAENILAKKGFTDNGEDPNISRTPLYPMVLAIQFYLFGNGYYINLFFNILFQSLVCIVIYVLGLRAFKEQRVAIVAALIWALYPIPMLQAMGPHTEPFYELLLVLFVFFLYEFMVASENANLFKAAVLMVLLTLTRPISILYPIYFSIMILFFFNHKITKKIKIITSFLIIFLIGISPWMVRAYKITGQVIPLVSYKPLYHFVKSDDVKTRPETLILNSKGQHPGYLSKFLKEIKNPKHFIKSTLIRFTRFWYYGHSTTVRVVNAILQFPMLLMAIAGLSIAYKRDKSLTLAIASTVAYFWLAYSATHAISRYSFPMIAVLCPLISLSLIAIFNTFINGLFPSPDSCL